MVHSQPVDDTKYAGPSKTIEVLGRANAYGWIGGIAGLAAGGIGAGLGTQEAGKGVEKTTEFLKNFGIHVNGKWAIIAAGAIATSQVLHYVGVAIGLRVGAVNAGQGQAQFERVTARCGVLKEELRELKSERKQHQDEFHKDQEAVPTAEPTTTVNSITRDCLGADSLVTHQANRR